MILTNNTLSFNSVAEGNNWNLGLSTDNTNNLTITGSTGYIDLNFNKLRIRGEAGNAGQVLTSGGTNGSFTWEDGTGGGWSSTAESNLNMGTYDITSTSGTLDISANVINIGKDVFIPGKLTVGSTGPVTLFGGDSFIVFNTTTENDIQKRISVNGRNQFYNAFIAPDSSGSGILILPNVKTSHYVYVYNASSFNWTIATQSGERIAQGIAGNTSFNIVSMIIQPTQTLAFCQIDGGIGSKINLISSDVIQGTGARFSTVTTSSSVITPTINGNNGPITIGTGLNTTNVNIGRLPQTINLAGNIRINGNTGIANQVLTSTGNSPPTWQSPIIPSSYAINNLNNFVLSNTTYNLFNSITLTIPSTTARYLLSGCVNISDDGSGTKPDVFFSFFMCAGTIIDASSINVTNSVSVNTKLTSNTCIMFGSCSSMNVVSYSYIYTPNVTGMYTFGMFLTPTATGGKRNHSNFSILQLAG
jgi:hypothetical protein